MTAIRDQYLDACDTALGLLADDAVRSRWSQASALDGFTVGGLAAHLAAQITSAVQALDADYTGKDRIGLFDHYERAAWVGADIDNDANTAIRAGGETDAAAGPDAVLTDTRTALAALRGRLPALEPDATGGNPRWPYATAFDDFLVTRILELVVHSDDLAVSCDRPTPTFAPDVFDTAAWALTRISAARHGQPALIRALARAERAPDTITAL
jgi:hypothetical protein